MNNLLTLGLLIGTGIGFALCLAIVEITDRIAARRLWRREGD